MRASNGGQSSSVGDVDVPNIVQDVEALLENSVTRRNGKVCEYLRDLLKMYMTTSHSLIRAVW